jgi:hypothetical protein
MADKKNTDYSKSAVSLTDSQEVKDAYERYKAAMGAVELLQTEIAATPTYQRLQKEVAEAGELLEVVKQMVKDNGGFQDVVAGHYALQQRRVSKSYNADVFAKFFPEYTPQVLMTAVNVPALEDLVKEGKVSEAALLMNGVITTKESLAFVIK